MIFLKNFINNICNIYHTYLVEISKFIVKKVTYFNKMMYR